jgi:hypothetical protein
MGRLSPGLRHRGHHILPLAFAFGTRAGLQPSVQASRAAATALPKAGAKPEGRSDCISPLSLFLSSVSGD